MLNRFYWSFDSRPFTVGLVKVNRDLVFTLKSWRWFLGIPKLGLCSVNGEWLVSLDSSVRGSSSCCWCSSSNRIRSSGWRVGDLGVMSSFPSAVVGEVTGCLGAAASPSPGYGRPAALVSPSHVLVTGDRQSESLRFLGQRSDAKINISSQGLSVWTIASLRIQLAYGLNSYFHTIFILEGQTIHEHKFLFTSPLL